MMEGHRGLERRNQAQNQKNESPTERMALSMWIYRMSLSYHAGDGTIHRGTKNWARTTFFSY